MYWAVREDGNFEVIDGQQRTISISQLLKEILHSKVDTSTIYKRRTRANPKL
jgi:uncharacterized protein with ParB-like and HNH nuclease domain